MQFLKRFLILVVVAFALAAADETRRGFTMPAPAPVAPKVPAAAAAFHEMVKAGGIQVIDARPLEKFAAGHVPGAISLAFGDFQAGEPPVLATLERGKKTVVYCEGGDCTASKEVEEMLRSYGFTEVQVFEEGFPAWEAAGYEVEKDQP